MVHLLGCLTLFWQIRSHLKSNIVGGFYKFAKFIKLNVLITVPLNKCTKAEKRDIREESIKNRLKEKQNGPTRTEPLKRSCSPMSPCCCFFPTYSSNIEDVFFLTHCNRRP